MLKDFFLKYKFVHLFVFIIPPLFYFFTLFGSVGLGDAAMIINKMVNCSFSTHANNHNLAIFFGWLFIKLPIPCELAYKCNLMSAFFGYLSIILFYFLVLRMTKKYLTSLISTAIVMVSHSFWWHSTQVENYIVTVFLILLIIHCYISYANKKNIVYIYIAFILSGLSVFNHIQNGVWLISTIAFALIYRKDIFNTETKTYAKIVSAIFSILSVAMLIIVLLKFNDIVKGDQKSDLLISIIKDGLYFLILLSVIGLLSSILFIVNKKSVVIKKSFSWVKLVIFSAISYFIGLLPYIATFLFDLKNRSGNILSVIDIATGGRFKESTMKFSPNGLSQSFWYTHLQFPSVFHLFIIMGVIYFTLFAIINRKKHIEISNKTNKICNIFLIITFATLIINIIFYCVNFLNIWNHYFFSTVLFFILLVIGFLLLMKLNNFDSFKYPAKEKYFKVIITLLAFPLLITDIFFACFFDTWDQYAFLLPSFIIGAIVGSLLLDKLFNTIFEKYEEYKNTKKVNKINVLYWCIIVLCIFGIIFPVYYYSQIGKWSYDPTSWWFEHGPYMDKRFINTHNRVEYNYNPDKSNFKDVEIIVNLLFEKLPQNAIVIDDDSRMYYPIALYYKKYVEKFKNWRNDIKFKMMNVWGHTGWGTSVDGIVKEINSNKDENYFLMAIRSYPYNEIVSKLDSNKQIFLPYKLDNTHWIYKLKNFTEEEKLSFESDFPPFFVRYMYFGTNIKKFDEKAGDVFNTNDDIMIRIVFERLSDKIKPFPIILNVYDEEGNLLNQVQSEIKGGWKALNQSLDVKNKLKEGKYTMKALVYNIEVFERSFEIRNH